MAFEIISSDDTNGYVVDNGDEVVLLAGVTISNTLGDAISDNPGSAADLFIYGTVAGAVYGIHFNEVTTANVTIGSTGVSIGAVAGFVFSGTTLYMTNAGEITGGGEAFSHNAGVATNLTNTGLIHSSGESAIYNTSTVLRLTNSGTISGRGTIDDETIEVASQLIMTNSGSVLSTAGYAIGTGVGDDILRNSGFIDGIVQLSSGADQYIGLGDGLVTGTIMGEGGNDTLIGGNLSDTMDGGVDADILRGQGGDDELIGGMGNDTLLGGSGADDILGGSESDQLGGGSGNDSLDGGTENDTVNGGAGNDTLLGGNGNDSLTGGGDDDVLNGNSKNDTLLGGAGDDTLDGGNDDDVLYGQQGNDELFGTAGFDTLNGGGGDDLLDGGGRNDHLDGGGGDDTLTGAGGNDRFIFERHAGHDVITDMTNGSDVIDLSAFGLQNFNRLNLLGALSSEQGGVLIDLSAIGGSGSIWLDGFAIGDLDSSDFIF